MDSLGRRYRTPRIRLKKGNGWNARGTLIFSPNGRRNVLACGQRPKAGPFKPRCSSESRTPIAMSSPAKCFKDPTCPVLTTPASMILGFSSSPVRPAKNKARRANWNSATYSPESNHVDCKLQAMLRPLPPFKLNLGEPCWLLHKLLSHINANILNIASQINLFSCSVMASAAFTADGAIYLDVPYRCKDEAKLAGAFWDPLVKRWAIDVGDAEALRQFWPRVHAAAIHAAVEKSHQAAAGHQAAAIENCTGDGECFIHGTKGPIRIGACPNGCELKHCSDCLVPLPERDWNAHKGRCLPCAVLEYSNVLKVPAGYCESCGGKLVPIGSRRSNGAGHDDWDDRRFHKQCYKAGL